MDKVITFLLLVLSTIPSQGVSVKNDSLRFEILLTSKMLKDINFSGKFLNTLDITSNNLILLSTNNQFYLVGWGGIVPLGERLAGKISTYAYAPDSLLITVKENEVCRINSTGDLITLFKLPNPGMGISAGRNVMYFYDRTKDQQKNGLFVLAQGGNYGKIIELNTPINSVLEVNNSILFSARSAVFKLDTKSRQLKEIVALPADKNIISLAVNQNNGRIYFSTETAIYTFLDSALVTITEKFGGVLRYFKDGLIIFDPEKNLLIRMTGIDDKITTEMMSARRSKEIRPILKILNNSSIIRLVNENTSEEKIIDLINNSQVKFNTSVDSMIFLSDQKVPSRVIMAMRDAMRRTGNTSAADAAKTQTEGNKLIENQPAQNTGSTTATTTAVKRFYIIIGSYPTEQQAKEAVEDLKKKGYKDAEVAGISSSGTYRIASKGYVTNEEAARDLADVRSNLNSSAWIFEKK